MGLFDWIGEKTCEALEVIEDRTMSFLDEVERSMDHKFDKVNTILDSSTSTTEKIKVMFNINETTENTQRTKPIKGDIIGIHRNIVGASYVHYGIYVGNNEVIHFTNLIESFNPSDNSIMKTDLSHFLKGATNFFVLFPNNRKKIKIMSPPPSSSFIGKPSNVSLQHTFHLYSPEETVNRAYSKIGRKGYNLLVNNCEHFAIWCKTGQYVSLQINDLLSGNMLEKQYITF
jgi:hypothetical protein